MDELGRRGNEETRKKKRVKKEEGWESKEKKGEEKGIKGRRRERYTN